MEKSRLKTLTELCCVFFKIGAVTFGGGMAMLPIIERELAVKRDWVTSEELLDYFTLCQSTPGIIAANISIFLGYKRAGKLGAIIAPLAVITPSIIVISIIAAFLNNFSEISLVRKALAGINVGVAAMMTYTVYNFAKKGVKGIFGAIIFALAFVTLYFFKVNTVWIILFGAIIGVIAAGMNGELKGAEK